MRFPAAGLLLLLLAGNVLAQPILETTLLDDFEDVSAWIKGDPKTDMEQLEAGYAPNTEFVKEGKQSLAFMIRVDWTERPEVKYAKGWPMLSRQFEEAQDWSTYDRLEFWVYPETEAMLPLPKALRVAAGTPDGKAGEWKDIVLRKNVWNHVSVRLDEERDWSKVTGVWFYIAEAWYKDGDRVNFYLDDMRLAKLTAPRILTSSATARTSPRGQCAELYLCVEGPADGVTLEARVLTGETEESSCKMPLKGKRARYEIPLGEATPGGHELELRLAGDNGTVHAETRQYFRSMEPGKRCYLNLITFYTSRINGWTDEQIKVINDSPYEGVASTLIGGYDTDPIPEYETWAESVKLLRDNCEFHVWPWVFSNRIVGRMADAPSHASANAKAPEYFDRINCVDLDDKAGALSDMLKSWRHAVKMAKELGAPGIVIDLEAYNNYKTYHLPYVAEHRGETIGDVARAFEAIGESLGRIVEEEYPECIVWSLFSRLKPAELQADDYEGDLFPTPGHVTLGFLRYCRENGVPAKFLCGGEVEVGYYNANVEALKQRIRDRDAAHAPALEQYPDHYFLAGTISPYHDYKVNTSWIQKQAGDDPELKTIEDFQPMFKTLFDAYDWLWTYNSSAAKTLPYNPENAARYGKVLEAALEESAGR